MGFLRQHAAALDLELAQADVDQTIPARVQRPRPAADPGICSRGKWSIILASLTSDPQGARMTTPTKTGYWTLVDEHTDITMGTKIETITYDAKAPGGKLVRTVTRYREAFVESMVFVPMPPVPPAV